MGVSRKAPLQGVGLGCSSGLELLQPFRLLWNVLLETVYLHLLLCSLNPQAGSLSAHRANQHLILSVELSSAIKTGLGPGLDQDSNDSGLGLPSWRSQTVGSLQDGGCSSREESQASLGSTPMGVCVHQEDSAGFGRQGWCSLSPPHFPAVGPRGLGPVRMVAAPNGNQGRPRLRSSFYSAPPALSLRLGPSQRLLRSLQIPTCSLLFAAVRRPGRRGPKSPSSWLPGLGGLPEGEPRDRSRRRLGPAGRALGALESILVRGGETCVLDQHCLC